MAVNSALFLCLTGQHFLGCVSEDVSGFYFLPTSEGVSWLVSVQKWVSHSPPLCGALGVDLVPHPHHPWKSE